MVVGADEFGMRRVDFVHFEAVSCFSSFRDDSAALGLLGRLLNFFSELGY